MINCYSSKGFPEDPEELEEGLNVYIRFSVVGESTGQDNILGFVTLGRINSVNTDFLGVSYGAYLDHGNLCPETESFLGIPEISNVSSINS